MKKFVWLLWAFLSFNTLFAGGDWGKGSYLLDTTVFTSKSANKLKALSERIVQEITSQKDLNTTFGKDSLRKRLEKYNLDNRPYQELFVFIDDLETGEAVVNRNLNLEGTYPGGILLQPLLEWKEVKQNRAWNTLQTRRRDSANLSDSLEYRKILLAAKDTVLKKKAGIIHRFAYQLRKDDPTFAYITHCNMQIEGKTQHYLIGISVAVKYLVEQAEKERQETRQTMYVFVAFLLMMSAIYIFWENRRLKKYKLALDNSENGIILMDTEGKVEWHNKKIEARYGKKISSIYDITTIAEPLLRGKIAEAVAGGKNVQYASKKEEQYYQTRLTYLPDSEQIIAIDLNTTETEEGQEIMNYAHNGLALLNEVNGKLCYEYMNAQLREYYTKRLGREVGLEEDLYDLSLNPQAFRKALEKCKAEKKGHYYSNYQDRHFQTSLTQITLSRREKYILENTDVTELLHEQVLTHSFFITLAHGIKNEINPYINLVNMVLRDKNPEIVEKGQTITERFQRLEKLTKEKAFLQKNTLFLQDFIQQILPNYKEKCQIHLNIPENICIKTDEEVFETIIKDILDNAIKHDATAISIVCVEKEAHYLLSFANNGKPISEKVAAILFQKKINSKGWGIALFMARRLLSFLDSQIYLADNQNVTFCIRLPKA
ncbi:MAG: sensor histidine kinase [Bacteroidia bacterium]